MNLNLLSRLALILSITFSISPPTIAKPGFALTKVADGLYVHQGKNAGLQSEYRDDIANIGFIVGEKCIAVIDTGGSIAIGQQLKKAIHRISKLPICYVINTHAHFDHVLGNYAFSHEKSIVVGHHKLQIALHNNQTFFQKNFAKELSIAGKITAVKTIIPPTLLVKDTLELDLGKRTLVLHAHSPAHTHHDLSIVDIKTNTLWLSDLLFTQRIPSIDTTGSVNGWLALIDNLKLQKFKRVIPGHGSIEARWPGAIEAEQVYLKMLRTDIRTLLSHGGFLEQALKSAGQSEKEKWQLFEENHPRNVSRVFKELEWE